MEKKTSENFEKEFISKYETVSNARDLADLLEFIAKGVEDGFLEDLYLDSYLAGVGIAMSDLHGMYRFREFDIRSIPNWEQIGDSLSFGFDFA